MNLFRRADSRASAVAKDAYVLYRMGKAYHGKGDEAKAAELFRQAANHNTLPTLNRAFVRVKAKRMKA